MSTHAPSPLIIEDLTKVHLKPLDGLRGLAVLLVMFYHYGLLHPDSHGPQAGAILKTLHAGWVGVDLFFVLSGFLITGILLATRTQEHYFRNFLARRFLRIWPLYYANLVVFILIAPLFMNPLPVELQSMADKQVWFWLYAANWLYAIEGGFNQTSGGYFWSLAVEEQFYLIWPFVIFALSKRSILRLSLGLLAASLTCRIILGALDINTNALYTMTFTHWDGLAVGAILAVCYQSENMVRPLARIAPYVAATSLLMVLSIWFIEGDAFFWGYYTALYGYTLIAIFFGSILLLSLNAQQSSLWRTILQTPYLRTVGKFSYALYMIHVPIAAAVTPLLLRLLEAAGLRGNLGFAAAVAINFLLSFILAFLSWHLFEKRLLALKSLFSYRDDRAAAGRAAVAQRVSADP